MRLSLSSFIVATLAATASALDLIESKSLNPCQANSSFTATLFNVIFTPGNKSVHFEINGLSEIEGNVTADLRLIAYGYTAIREKLDPCTMDLQGMCPMSAGTINLESNIDVPDDVIKQIPGIAFNVPDLDGKVRVYINDTQTGRSLACVEAELSNGKTVDQKAVGWTTAVIAGGGLLASAITSGLGHSNTAAHVAANAMSLFGYFQGQALIGMSAVNMPPIVASWTQNFQWSLGIIRVGFLQSLATWYQRSTGGTPSQVLSSLSFLSVQVQKRKRSLEIANVAKRMVARGYESIVKRSNNQATNAETSQVIQVHGIQRVGFRANIELTNIFMTGYIFFVIFVLFVVLAVVIFKGILELLAKSGKMKGEKFQDFRKGWKTVLRGILFRIVLIGFPQICVLGIWEITTRDSAAEVVLAIFTLVGMIAVLSWASLKVIRLARRSIQLHQSPAYILYSDPNSLNKWGFLYVQFKATAYYFIVPILFYIFLKALFIGVAQGNGTVQAIALLILEAALLIVLSIMRPYMDKKTNGFNIAIAAINFISAIFLVFFTEIFGQPGIVTGVMGVIFFIMNAAFALILLVMVLVSSIYALVSKNPDTRYQPMRDDRGSFIKSQTQLTTELDALGATARGEGKTAYGSRSRIEDDDDSFSSGSIERQKEASGITRPVSSVNYSSAPRSPIDPSVPMFPSDGQGRHGPPPTYASYGQRSNTSSPVSYGRPPSMRQTPSQFRTQNNSSPWQRGAGYDH